MGVLSQPRLFTASTPTFPPTYTPTVTPPVQINDAKGVPMRLVPAGTFQMGNGNTGSSPDEQPLQDIYLESFYIDQYEVTNALYKACVDAGVCDPPKETSSDTRSNYWDSGYDNYPVIYVNWFMAKTYCEWRGAQLPTEAQWEKAARGTDGRTYPWGGGSHCYANTAGCGYTYDTMPVGSFTYGLSPYGIYDMIGNVGEWVSSLYILYPYNPTDGREDLSSPGKRVVRGGTWGSGATTTTNRDRHEPDVADLYTGFRCASSILPNFNTSPSVTPDQ